MNNEIEQDRREWVKPELVDIDAGQGDIESTPNRPSTDFNSVGS